MTKGMKLTKVYIFSLTSFGKEPILKPISSCPGLLSPQEYNKGALGWFVLISAIVPLTFPERSFFLVQFSLSFLAPYAPHLEQWEGIWVYSPTVAVYYRYTHKCSMNSMYTHLYTWLQLFLGICTRWLWGVNQRVALRYSSDMCMLLCCSCPALSFPKLPSLVPFQRTGRPVVEPAEPWSALHLECGGGLRMERPWREPRQLSLCKLSGGIFPFLM